MENVIDGIVRVLGGREGETVHFLGTGLLVAPDRVLTCQHVVTRPDGRGGWTDVPLPSLQVQRADGTRVAVKPPPVFASAWDLALVELEGTWPAQVPPLLWGLTETLASHLRRAPIWVYGYSQGESASLWQHPVKDLFGLPTVSESTGIIAQIQLSGGIPQGCSGGPALLRWGERWVYVGTIYLGGEKSATSRLIMADPVAEFLHEAELHEFPRLDAPRALQLTPIDKIEAERFIECPGIQEVRPNPYRGLAYFRELDAPYFFGREADSEALLEVIQRHPLVTLIGASGSGKSSLLLAGLVPRLRERAHWQIVRFRPADKPFRGLAGALARLFYPELELWQLGTKQTAMAEDLLAERMSLVDAMSTWHEAHPEQRVLLIADQFEELYTQTIAEDQCRRFLDAVLALIETQRTAAFCTVLLALRVDFMEKLLAYAPMGKAIDANAKKMLGPMDTEGLRAAAEGPAGLLGMHLEEGLAKIILQDVGESQGNLSLLEFALTELWRCQTDGQLTHQAYEAIGGVQGALALYADAALEELKAPLAQVRRIFVQLVRPGEGTKDTRQVASREHIGEAAWPLVKRLADKRLVVTGGDEAGAQQTVELIHEALIGHWQTLRDWMAEDREFRSWQNRLRHDLNEWQRQGRDEGALLHGARLAEAEEKREGFSDRISKNERNYIETSVGVRDKEAVARRRRQRTTVLGLVAGLVVAVGLALWANIERNEATQARAEAEKQRNFAVARQLATQADQVLHSRPDALELGALLATTSLERAHTLEGHEVWGETVGLLPKRHMRMRHGSWVNGVAFSPEGMRVLSGGVDGTARIWELETGRELRRLVHEREVTSVAFSPDGSRAMTSSSDNTARVWEVETGVELARLEHRGVVRSTAFSPDGKRVVSGSNDNTARVWEIETGQEVARLEHGGSVDSVAFSSDGKRIVTGSQADYTARVWEADTGREVMRLVHGNLYGTENSMSMAFSPDGKRVVTTVHNRMWGNESLVRVWEVGTGVELARLSDTSTSVLPVFSSDGKRLVTAHEDKSTVRVWEVETGVELVRLKLEHGDGDWVRAVAFSSDGARVLAENSLVQRVDDPSELGLTKNDDKTVSVWEVSTGVQLARLPGGVYSVFSRDGKRVVTIDDANTARVWEVATGEVVARLKLEGYDSSSFPKHEGYGSSSFLESLAIDRFAGGDIPLIEILAFSRDGTRVVTGSDDNTARVWEVETGKELALLEHGGTVSSVAFSPDGSRVVTGSDDDAARVWEVETGEELALLEHGGSVSSVAFSPDGTRVVTGSDDDAARVWEVETGKELALLEYGGRVDSVAFSPDGKRILTGSQADNTARVWEADTGREVMRLVHGGQWRRESAMFVAFSPGGTLVATGGHDRIVRVWHVETGEEFARLEHGGKVGAVAFSPNGRRVLTGSDDDAARVWVLETGEELALLEHGGSVSSVAFSPDGTRVVTGSDDKTARVWDADAGRELARLVHEVRGC